MKCLELFAGTRSFGKVAQQMGMEVFATDIKPFEGIDYVTDILDFDIQKIPFEPNIIWASPPCTYFSILNQHNHFRKVQAKYSKIPKYLPVSERAQKSLLWVEKTLEIIKVLKPNYFFIENPRDILRFLPIMKEINLECKMETLAYLDYGFTVYKPTNIWHNSNWKAKPMTKKKDLNGRNCPFETINRKACEIINRSAVPSALISEILKNL